MKVAVYVGNVPPSLGGAFTFQQEVVAALRERAGDSPHRFVILGGFGAPDRATIESANVQVCQVGSARMSSVIGNLAEIFFEKPLLVLRAMGLRSRLDRLLRRHGVELVWFVGPVYETTDCPFIFTVWDLQHRLQPWFPEVSSSGRWIFRERNYGRVVPRATLVIAPNRAGQEEVERFYHVPASRIRLLPHPTPSFALRPPSVLPDIRTRFGLQGPYVLYPAQFWAHKNHVGLLRAMRALLDRHRQSMDVALVGSEKGNLAHIRKEVDRLGLGQAVRFLGFVQREELVALYRNAEALVYLSFFGPENLPPLEAFALGCPVVAARVPGAEEQFGDAALLVDPTDPQEVADAVRRVTNEPTLRSLLIERGRQRAQNWTAGDYVASVLAEIDRFAPVRACWSDETMPIA